MSGLASRNRYHAFDWMRGAPYPGELEYMTGVTKRQAGREKWLARQTVTRDTQVRPGRVDNTTHEHANTEAPRNPRL